MRLYEIINEGRLKNHEIDKDFNRIPIDFNVMINGKIWCRNGEPVLFKDHAAALRAADKITADRNITTQVVPSKRKGP